MIIIGAETWAGEDILIGSDWELEDTLRWQLGNHETATPFSTRLRCWFYSQQKHHLHTEHHARLETSANSQKLGFAICCPFLIVNRTSVLFWLLDGHNKHLKVSPRAAGDCGRLVEYVRNSPRPARPDFSTEGRVAAGAHQARLIQSPALVIKQLIGGNKNLQPRCPDGTVWTCPINRVTGKLINNWNLHHKLFQPPLIIRTVSVIGWLWWGKRLLQPPEK